MSIWLRFRQRTADLFARHRREDDLEREIHTHLDLEAEEQHESGVPHEEAPYAARRALGNIMLIREATREMWGWTSLERFSQDLRYAGRMLRKNPVFMIAVILTLALGIGANTAIFSVVDLVLLRPLPYRDPARLVHIETKNSPLHISSGPASYPDFLDWRASGIFEDAGIYLIGNSILRVGDGSQRVQSGAASASFLSLLGVRPMIGRLPLPEEDRPSVNPVVLLSENLWRRQFGGDPSIVGRTVNLGGKPLVVIGVLPSSFVFERDPELWQTFELTGELEPRDNRFLDVLARLRPGDSLQQADSRLAALCIHLAEQYPKSNQDWSADPFPWQESQVGHFRTQLLVLLGAVCLVLFICCGNVATLLLVRGTGRLREIAVRSALGASRTRIVRQLLTENLFISLLGGSLGVALAAWCVSLFARYGPADIPRLAQAHVDLRILLFALSLSILTTLLFGLGPALQLSRPEVNAALQESGKSSTASRRRSLLRSALLAGETALSLVLLVGAALLVKSFIRLTSVDPGFRTDHLLTFHLPLPTNKFLTNGKYLKTQVVQYYEQVVEHLEHRPQVESAAATSELPLGGGGYRTWQGFALPRHPATAISKTLCVGQIVTPHFFRAMGIPLRAGRPFSASDDMTGLPVAIINETFARKYFPGENPIGQQVQLEGSPAMLEIVGVTGDVKPDGLDSESNPEVYAPHAQQPKPYMAIVVRTKTDPLSLAATVRDELMRIDRDVPPYRVRSAEHILDLSLAERRFSMTLMTAFAFIALILASIGLYGVISYRVAQSTREIGIRMALGARPADVLTLVLSLGLAPSVLGLAIGLVLSFGLTRLMSSLLYEVKPLDPIVLAVAPLALAAVSVLACLLPARRALHVDPVTALRYE
jgi:putative ABC transport system permease protein